MYKTLSIILDEESFSIMSIQEAKESFASPDTTKKYLALVDFFCERAANRANNLATLTMKMCQLQTQTATCILHQSTSNQLKNIHQGLNFFMLCLVGQSRLWSAS